MNYFKKYFKLFMILIIIFLLSSYIIISSKDTINIANDRIENNNKSPFFKENDFEAIPPGKVDNRSTNDVDEIIKESKRKILANQKEDAFGQKEICSYGCESSEYKLPSNPIQNERRKSSKKEISSNQDGQSLEFSIKKDF
jgi:hypothetical protein